MAQLGPVTAVVLSVSIIAIGAGLMTTRVSLDLEAHKEAVNSVRLVVTSYPVGFIIGCLTVRRLVEWCGHGRAFLLLIALLAALTLAFASTGDFRVWAVLRFGVGFSLSSIFTIVESWINLDSRSDNRGTLVSFYMIFSTLGTAAGPALVGLSITQGNAAPFIAALIFLISALPLLLSRRMRPAGSIQQERPQTDRPLALLALLAAAPAAFAAALQTGMTNMPFSVMMPIYAVRVGYDPAQAGALVSTFALGGLAAQWPIGWLSDRLPRHKVLAAAAGTAGITCCLIVLFGQVSAVVLFTLVFIFGCTALSIYPLALAYAGSAVQATFLVSLSSRLLLLHGMGSAIAPALSNELMARFGPPALFFVLGAATLSVGAIAIFGTPFKLAKEPSS